MNRLTLIITLTAIALAPAGVRAQTSLHTIGDEFHNAGHDVLRVWASPFHIDSNDIPEVAAAGLAIGASALADAHVHSWVRANTEQIHKVFGVFTEKSPVSKLGFLGPLAGLSGVMYIAGAAFDDTELRRAGLACIVSVTAGSVERHVVQKIVSRARPGITADPFDFTLGSGDWNQRSFWAGHSANIVTCATAWNQSFQMGPAEIAVYALAGGISLGRIFDEAHWFSDTVTGVIIGYAIGNLVATRMTERDAKQQQQTVPLRLTFKVPI